MSRYLTGFVLALVSLLAMCTVGCESPDRTVTLALRGIDNDRTWDILLTIVPKLADEDNYSLSCSWDQSHSYISLSPVRDVEGCARKIRFGKVERIDGRTIYVQLHPRSVRLEAWLTEATKFLQSTRRLLLDRID
jgi:hypothetical protein